MRLSAIFLLLLAGAAILTSMAAWGITYGTSYDKVSGMASDFTDVSYQNLKSFGLFISDLLHTDAGLVDGILVLQRQTVHAGTEQTTTQMARTIGALLNYTTNATGESQRQVNSVVDTFDTLMNAVVTDFKGLASGYAEQVRIDLASKGSQLLVTYSNSAGGVMKRIQKLIDIGILDLSRDPTDSISSADCTLLNVLCDGTDDFGSTFVLASATGRLYRCGPSEGGTVSLVAFEGGLYNESYQKWAPYPSKVPTSARQTMKQRCLADPPNTTQVVGLDCPAPQGCQCGADPRCSPWCPPQATGSAYRFLSNVYYSQSGVPTLHMTMPLFASSATSVTFLGVIDGQLDLTAIDYYMGALLGFSTDTYLAMLLNDTNLTTMGSIVRKCAANDAPPGDPAMPLRTGFRSCDPGLRAVAQWLANNRSAMGTFTLEAAGIVWTIFPTQTAVVSFFFVVGTNRSITNRAIDTSAAWAAAQLSSVRSNVLLEVVASGQATQAYMAALGAQNIQEAQTLQADFLTEVGTMENASRASLAASQARSSAKVQAMMESQTAAVEAQRAAYLASMAVTSGWTIAVVVALLLLALLGSAWRTFRVTQSLNRIIRLMEDVAAMRVEDLEVPRDSGVEEVARIQTAFQVLVRRLVEYKSYIPAGLFEKGESSRPQVGEGSDDGRASEDDNTSCPSPTTHVSGGRQTDCKLIQLQSASTISGTDAVVGTSRRSGSSGGAVPPSPARRTARRNVAVLSVNVLGFMDVLVAAGDGLAKNLFNDYIARVHESVSQGRGNVDCVLGDQVFVTFNAHLPCSDPAGAAAMAALDVRGQLLQRLGDRLRFQIGVAFGPVFAGSVGYVRFKTMVTVGCPMKMASLLSHVGRLENGTILADAALEEVAKYSYSFRPLELVNVSHVKSFAPSASTSQRISILLSRKNLREDEWIYQVDDKASHPDWSRVFDQLVAARSAQEGQSLLQKYLAGCPHDEVALRLKDRLALWIPGAGIPL